MCYMLGKKPVLVNDSCEVTGVLFLGAFVLFVSWCFVCVWGGAAAPLPRRLGTGQCFFIKQNKLINFATDRAASAIIWTVKHVRQTVTKTKMHIPRLHMDDNLGI